MHCPLKAGMLLAVALCTLNIVLETTAAGAQNSYSPPELLHGVENLEALLRKPLASGSSEDCQSRSDGLPRDIVGGRVVSPPWRYPYVVHLVSYYGYSAGCSGALIARDVVVTARHCIGNPPITNVWIGRWDLYDQKEVYQSLFVVDVAEYSTSSDKYVHDIALLKLSGDAWHRPVAMDGEKSDDLANHVEYNDLRVTSMGWPQVQDVPCNNKLRQVTMPGFSYGVCKNKFWSNYLQNGMICAGGIGQGSCEGESGGPLIVSKEEQAEFAMTKKKNKPEQYCEDILVGIVSFGPKGCGSLRRSDDDDEGDYDLEGKPTVYTKIAEYIPWIRKQLVMWESYPRIPVPCSAIGGGATENDSSDT